MSTGKCFLSNADANTPAAANLYVNQSVSGLSLAHLCPCSSRFEKIIKKLLMKKLLRWNVAKVKKSSDDMPELDQSTEPLLIELSTTAKTNLKKLQLLSLDRQGRQPEPSQIIEKLINAAAVSGPDAPYPA